MILLIRMVKRWNSNVVVAKGTINNADNMTVDTGFMKHLNIALGTMYGKTLTKTVFKILMKREFKV